MYWNGVLPSMDRSVERRTRYLSNYSSRKEARIDTDILLCGRIKYVGKARRPLGLLRKLVGTNREVMNKLKRRYTMV